MVPSSQSLFMNKSMYSLIYSDMIGKYCGSAFISLSLTGSVEGVIFSDKYLRWLHWFYRFV